MADASRPDEAAPRLPGLPDGITCRMLPGINGLDMHVLEAGDASHPALLLLHGFPELAYSWRKVMLPLAALDGPGIPQG